MDASIAPARRIAASWCRPTSPAATSQATIPRHAIFIRADALPARRRMRSTAGSVRNIAIGCDGVADERTMADDGCVDCLYPGDRDRGPFDAGRLRSRTASLVWPELLPCTGRLRRACGRAGTGAPSAGQPP